MCSLQIGSFLPPPFLLYIPISDCYGNKHLTCFLTNICIYSYPDLIIFSTFWQRDTLYNCKLQISSSFQQIIKIQEELSKNISAYVLYCLFMGQSKKITCRQPTPMCCWYADQGKPIVFTRTDRFLHITEGISQQFCFHICSFVSCLQQPRDTLSVTVSLSY